MDLKTRRKWSVKDMKTRNRNIAAWRIGFMIPVREIIIAIRSLSRMKME